MPRVSVLFLTGLLVALPLAGCGNKGPLVLPDQQQPKKHKSSMAPQSPAPKPADATPAGGTDAGH